MNCLPRQAARNPGPVSDADWVLVEEKHRDAVTKDKAPAPVVEPGLVLKADKSRYILDCPNVVFTISLL